jgi:hypothetical protein
MMHPQPANDTSWDMADAASLLGLDPVAAAVNEAKPPYAITPTPYRWRDPKSIPLRPWVYGRVMLRGTVSLVIAPGATGKTSFLVGTTLALATGKPLHGYTVWERSQRVWLWNLEDDGEELSRLIQAASIHFGLREEEIGTNLFVDSGMDGAIITLAKIDGRDGVKIIAPVVEAMVEALTSRKIDVIVLDPFISTHAVPENDNGAIDRVVKEWGRVANRAKCCIVLAHHTPKLRGMEVTVEGARGAVSMTQASRTALTLNRMTADQAERFGIAPAEAARYFRAYDDKHNRTPAAAHGDWFHLFSVPLNNGGLGGLARGDEMGVVVPWSPPDMNVVASDDQVALVQARIKGGEWRANLQSPAWVGIAIAEVMGLSLAMGADKAKVKALVSRWLAEGYLAVETRLDDNRRDRKFVTVGRKPGLETAPLEQGGAERGGAGEPCSHTTTRPSLGGGGGGGGAEGIDGEEETPEEG